MSALQIHRVIFGENSTHDYHTSWFMCMRWRAAMAGDMNRPLSGEVEIDETYIGGKDRNRRKNKKGACNVSKKYLPFHLNEFSYRFNNRKNEKMFADLITTCAQ